MEGNLVKIEGKSSSVRTSKLPYSLKEEVIAARVASRRRNRVDMIYILLFASRELSPISYTIQYFLYL
jgi:hypothetical protein